MLVSNSAQFAWFAMATDVSWFARRQIAVLFHSGKSQSPRCHYNLTALSIVLKFQKLHEEIHLRTLPSVLNENLINTIRSHYPQIRRQQYLVFFPDSQYRIIFSSCSYSFALLFPFNVLIHITLFYFAGYFSKDCLSLELFR